MRTTTRQGWRFEFSISDLGKLFGKSPVTVRSWDRKRLVEITRSPGGVRVVDCAGLRRIADWALSTGRIRQERYHLVAAVMTLVEQIEQSNDRKVKR